MSLCHVGGLRNSENLAGQRSYVIIITARKEGGAWERTPQGGPFSHGVVKDVVGPSTRHDADMYS